MHLEIIHPRHTTRKTAFFVLRLDDKTKHYKYFYSTDKQAKYSKKC